MKALLTFSTNQLLAFACVVLPAFSARAQIVADGATNTLSNVTTNITGDVTVGTNGSFTLLILSNNAVLTNSANGFIGRNATAKSNEVRLTSSSSRWLMGADLTVGDIGSFNRLTITNGGRVENRQGWVAYDPVSSLSSNNMVLVTGAGSSWSNRSELRMGYNGSGNQMIVSNGGSVVSANGFIGSDGGASSNLVTISGSGSQWRAQNLYVGNNGAFNLLNVDNGGQVTNVNGYIGFTGRTNTAWVTGTNSLWTSANDLVVGAFGSGNQFIVSNGATMSVGGGSALGLNSGANSNSVTVTDAGSSWLASAYIIVGSNGVANRLVVSNGARVIISNNYNFLVGYRPSSSSNMATVTGSGSLLRCDTGEVLVGPESEGNELVVSNGAVVEDIFGEIGGFSVFASNNVAVVTGVGSSWSTADAFYVGGGGRGNRLLINNGGTVTASNLVLIGESATSTNNSVVLSNGTLRASNAIGTAVLELRRGIFELDAGTVDVDRLTLTNVQGLFDFNGGTLITRGALITNTNLTYFTVGNAGAIPALWDVRAGASNLLSCSVLVGSTTSSNQLFVTNGAFLTGVSVLMGQQQSSKFNRALISGAGSQLHLSGALVPGLDSSFNRFEIANGARVAVAADAYTSGTFSSSNNVLIVTGTGSELSATNSFTVGFSGANDTLIVSNGATVISPSGKIGYNSTADANAAVVTGSGSVWSNGLLFVGYSGSGSQLLITNGGTVFAAVSAYVGYNSSAINNRIVVDGGTLRTTNGATSGLILNRGTNVLNSGLVEVDFLFSQFASGVFEFNGGTLKSGPGDSTYNNGHLFIVGDGARTATLQLSGGSNYFANGLFLNNHATLTGNGTVAGLLSMSSGATLSPGDGISTLTFTTSPVSLQGTTIMEVLKVGATKLYDQVHATGTLIYGGTLNVSNVGIAAFTVGDNFKLFSATSYLGPFASLNLPPLNAGLGWTNKLLVDGSIEVVAVSVPQPKIANITTSGTNIVISGSNGPPNASYAVLTTTNVTLPSSNWLSLATNQFDSGGTFSFTNGIVPGIPQRFFRIRVP